MRDRSKTLRPFSTSPFYFLQHEKVSCDWFKFPVVIFFLPHLVYVVMVLLHIYYHEVKIKINWITSLWQNVWIFNEQCIFYFIMRQKIDAIMFVLFSFSLNMRLSFCLYWYLSVKSWTFGFTVWNWNMYMQLYKSCTHINL